MTKIPLYTLAGLVAAIEVVPAAQSHAPATVRVDTGELQGVVDDGVISFKGIPFAAPPVGELRWRPPQPAAKWTGVRHAAEFGASCMQGRGFGPPAVQPPSEDCLYLNVWRPADPAARNLPVMVWIYGGGFTGGSSSSPNTSGVGFAKQGVVLVAMNYRVGRFGFFAHPALSRERPEENKGNYAYLDQIAALQWVKRNIGSFGGNPNNVTIFGFSAGGVSVHSMLASPQARGLFHKAIAESGGSRDSVLTARPMRADGVDLRDAPAQPGPNAPSHETTPILDGKLITETAETAYKARRQPRVPLMLGSNSADTAGNRVRARTKEEFFARYGQWSAESKAAYDPDAGTGAGGGSARRRNPYVFGTLSGGRGGTPTAEDLAVSRMAQGYWVNFAKTGDPNGAGLPTWPRHAAGKDGRSSLMARPDEGAGRLEAATRDCRCRFGYHRST